MTMQPSGWAGLRAELGEERENKACRIVSVVSLALSVVQGLLFPDILVTKR